MSTFVGGDQNSSLEGTMGGGGGSVNFPKKNGMEKKNAEKFEKQITC